MLPNNLGLSICLAVATVLSGPSAAFASGDAIACDPDQAAFVTPDGITRFSIEIADDAEERARGLMFRRELPEGQGMLFIYDTPRPVAFWMRNTLIPLDMIFLDQRGVIRHIHPMARPLDETPIPGAAADDPDPARLMILEIAGGEAERLGLEVGQPMAHPRIDPDLAALACR